MNLCISRLYHPFCEDFLWQSLGLETRSLNSHFYAFATKPWFLLISFVNKQTNKISWARLEASASRTSREEACWVCEQMGGCKGLKNIGYLSDTGLLCDEANHFTPRSFPFRFSGPRLSLNLCWCCIPQYNRVWMPPCAAGVWLSLCLFCSNQPFGGEERFISLSIASLWKEKRKKKNNNRHNFLLYLYTPILPRDVLCIYCELLKM